MTAYYMFQNLWAFEHLFKLIGDVAWAIFVVCVPLRVTKDVHDTFQIVRTESRHLSLIEMLFEKEVIKVGMGIDVTIEIFVGIHRIAIIELTLIQWKIGWGSKLIDTCSNIIDTV